MEFQKIHRLFAPCIPVKGFRRSIIADINRHQLLHIPNSLYNILTECRNMTLAEITEKYGKENESVVLDYFNYLESNELTFTIDKSELTLFPKLPMQWDFPSLCSNAIIDIEPNSSYDVEAAFRKLDEIDCFHLQIRVFFLTDRQYVERLLDSIHNKSFRSVHLVLDYSKELEDTCRDEWTRKFPKLAKTELFNAPKDSIYHLTNGLSLMIISKNQISSSSDCGKVSSKYFCIEMKHFTESQRHNTCLNRKVCIDAEGNIKNCPAMAKSFGNIRDTSLKEAIEKPGFKDLWYICKDQIDVCKDCEFRYMCTDCRCFIKDPGNIYSQPAKCTYNPYICLWEGQEGYVPVEECGTYSRETGFVPDKKRIAELNKRIWGEE